ncbi:hypothetical protein [Streptomyces sp. NPDC057676]|uniref:hypothetical protein n=1 Tax=Streptomyces sp. NPDC057676 TaxID=3346205 RepID=UPI0036A57134
MAPEAGTEALASQTSALFVGTSVGGVLGGLLLATGLRRRYPWWGARFAGLAPLPRRRTI